MELGAAADVGSPHITLIALHWSLVELGGAGWSQVV